MRKVQLRYVQDRPRKGPLKTFLRGKHLRLIGVSMTRRELAAPPAEVQGEGIDVLSR